jgi:serine protease Do
VIDQIIHSGTVHRAYLGIILQSVDKDLADALGLDKAEGILVSDIMKDSPAAKGGLLQGDVIVQYNQNPAKNVAKLRNEIAMMSPGDVINLKVLRNNRPLQLKIGLGSQTEVEVVTAETIQKMGLEVESLTPELAAKLNFPTDLQGVVITKVQPGSPAQAAGLRPSFLITGVA